MTTLRAHIRPAGIAEAAVLAALHGECFADAWSHQAMIDVVASAGTFAYLAMVPGSEAGEAPGALPAGFAIARLAADEAELLSIGVGARFRRRGIGLRLIAEVLRRATTAGARRIFLEVAEDNVGAQALYAAYSFTIVGRRPEYYRIPNATPVSALTLRRYLAGRNWHFP